MKKIAIYGAGGFGREVACLIRKINDQSPEWELVGFFDDGIKKDTKNEYGLVLGGIDEVNSYPEELAIVIAIASPKIVEKIVGNITSSKIYYPNIISPDVTFLDTDNVSVAHFASSLPSRYSFDPIDLFESITIGTLNVLNWMREVNCKKIVFPQTPSDMAKYHNKGELIPNDDTRHFPLTGDHAVYTIAKNAAVDLMEHYRAEFDIKFFALRFFTIYQYHPNPYHFADYKRRLMPFRMLMDRASKSLPIEIWGNCKKAKEMVYIKDFVRLVQACIESDKEGGCYNCGNGWQVSLEDQIKGIIEVFSPEDNPSKIYYCPEKPDPLQNAFDMSKTFMDFPSYRPIYSYLDQLIDFKKEMALEPMAQLWGVKEDYTE